MTRLLDLIPSEEYTEKIAAVGLNKDHGIILVARYKNYYGRRYIDIRKYSLKNKTWMKQGIMIPVENILYLVSEIALYVDDEIFWLRPW